MASIREVLVDPEDDLDNLEYEGVIRDELSLGEALAWLDENGLNTALVVDSGRDLAIGLLSLDRLLGVAKYRSLLAAFGGSPYGTKECELTGKRMPIMEEERPCPGGNKYACYLPGHENQCHCHVV